MQETFSAIVYLLCLVASFLCALLLARSYLRTRTRLLLLSAVCFALLAVNNLVVVLDILAVPTIDLRLARLGLSLAAVAVLLFGFIWDVQEHAE